MANQIIGKIIAIGNIETIASKDPSKQPLQKRQLYIDCTRYDAVTGERGYENTPVLEFGGKSIEKLNALVEQGLKKDDVVVISFDIQGTKYEKDGKKQVFTRVRPYDIALHQPTASAPTPPPAASPAKDPDLPFN